MADAAASVEGVGLDDPRLAAIAADELRRRLSGLPDEVAGPLVEAQLTSKLGALAAQHPDAVAELVIETGAPVAYVVTDAGAGATRLCDIAVIGAARGRGVGRALLARTLVRADAAGAAVELSVWHDAPARAWYERHGFRVVGGDRSGHLEMRREPASAPDDAARE